MKLTSETFRLAAGGPIFTAVEGFELSRLPISFPIPVAKRKVMEVWARAEDPSQVCLVMEWRDCAAYEWVIMDADGILCCEFSSLEYGSPEAAREGGLAGLLRHLLANEEAGLDDLREEIAAQADVKELLNLTCRGGVYFYQIETPFETFPRFVIGETDDDLSAARQIHKCSARENSDRAWECLMKTGSFNGLIPDLDSLLAPAGKETASDA